MLDEAPKATWGKARGHAFALQFLKHNRERFDWMEMISNHYPLERINEAIDRMRTWEEIKPAITFEAAD